MVWPVVLLALLATLVRVRSALAKTPSTAVAVEVLAPKDVTKDPDAIVLVTVPATELVTTVVTVQLEAGGINAPTDKVKVPKPTVAFAEPALQLVCAADVALTKFAG